MRTSDFDELLISNGGERAPIAVDQRCTHAPCPCRCGQVLGDLALFTRAEARHAAQQAARLEPGQAQGQGATPGAYGQYEGARMPEFLQG